MVKGSPRETRRSSSTDVIAMTDSSSRQSELLKRGDSRTREKQARVSKQSLSVLGSSACGCACGEGIGGGCGRFVVYIYAIL
ncbi:hypothetical protein HZH66_004370 [Vespula vulgaris]|uniref:Uncharacterized protein n=1 Tax=Vespula vulgaris TaxID=7454 RepID=A0A834KIM1_VESVU|nr:hypothetical protein HZH66_004370 [Vespula vulgaris]